MDGSRENNDLEDFLDDLRRKSAVLSGFDEYLVLTQKAIWVKIHSV